MSQNIFITGTNSGFGRRIALSLARSGHQVFATMRDTAGRNAEAAKSLTEEGAGRVTVLELSMTDDASIQKAAAAALDKAGHIDVLVNNAGFSVLGLNETLTSEQLLHQYNVNVVGPHRVMRALLPSMRGQGKGLIIQISSGAGRCVFPIMGAYCSSKHALEALSESYRYELKGTGVEVVIVQPGGYATDFAKNVIIGAEQDRAAAYGPMANALQGMQQALENFTGPNGANPQAVVDVVARLVDTPAGARPPRVVIDPQFAPLTEAVNQAHAGVQRELLQALGMGGLAD